MFSFLIRGSVLFIFDIPAKILERFPCSIANMAVSVGKVGHTLTFTTIGGSPVSYWVVRGKPV